MMFMIYKFHKNLFLEWPKIFENLVVKRKIAIIWTILFKEKVGH